MYSITSQKHNTLKHDGKFKKILCMRNHKNRLLDSELFTGIFWFLTALAYTDDGDLGPSDVVIPEPNHKIIKGIMWDNIQERRDYAVDHRIKLV